MDVDCRRPSQHATNLDSCYIEALYRDRLTVDGQLEVEDLLHQVADFVASPAGESLLRDADPSVPNEATCRGIDFD